MPCASLAHAFSSHASWLRPRRKPARGLLLDRISCTDSGLCFAASVSYVLPRRKPVWGLLLDRMPCASLAHASHLLLCSAYFNSRWEKVLFIQKIFFPHREIFFEKYSQYKRKPNSIHKEKFNVFQKPK